MLIVMAFFCFPEKKERKIEMKKKLITIFSLCAALVISMCSINLKSANAEEEQSASAEEEQIMEFTEGNTYYVSIDYYNEVLVPNKNAGIKTGDYVIRFYSEIYNS